MTNVPASFVERRAATGRDVMEHRGPRAVWEVFEVREPAGFWRRPQQPPGVAFALRPQEDTQLAPEYPHTQDNIHLPDIHIYIKSKLFYYFALMAIHVDINKRLDRRVDVEQAGPDQNLSSCLQSTYKEL